MISLQCIAAHFFFGWNTASIHVLPRKWQGCWDETGRCKGSSESCILIYHFVEKAVWITF